MASKKPTNQPSSYDIPPTFAADKIIQQHQRILNSSEFHATESQRKLFEFVVQQTVAGESDQIKGYTIATQVFGRKEDFDQNTDPIVSIHANKLRRALERYYLTAGTNDPVRIEIPKGSYVPTFSNPTADENNKPLSEGPTRINPVDSPWPAILVRPLQCLTHNSDENYLSIGLATELAVELSKYQDIRVIFQDPGGYGKRVSDTGIRFIIDGILRSDLTGIRLSIYLIDTINGSQLWGETHRFDPDAPVMAEFGEKIAQIIAVKLAGEYGVIAKTISAESRIKPPSELKAYEAIVRYYEFDRLLTPESFTRAMEALEYATTVEPECGQMWSMLGRIYGNIYSLELPGFESALEKAVAFAEKGIQLNPGCQRGRVILAFIRMLSNEIPAAIEEAEKSLDLNPNSLFILEGIGYLFILLGKWEHGRKLINRVTQISPYYGLYVHYALWLDWIRQEKYVQAHLETSNFYRPSVFWEPLMKAAVLGHLGRLEEAKQAAQSLLELKPDFPARGRTLIGHYIKFDDIAERIVNGLHKAGMKID